MTATYEEVGVAAGSPEWKAMRKFVLGASDMSWVNGDGVYGSFKDLWLQKTDRASEPWENPGMTRGKELEPQAISRLERWFHDHHGKDVALVPRFIRSTIHTEPQIVVSLDGDDRHHDITVEVKCPYPEKHAISLLGEVPDEHKAQLQTQLMVRRPKHHYFASFNPDVKYHELAVIEVFPDLEYQEKMMAQARVFWDYVRADKEPPDGAEDYVFLDDKYDKGKYAELVSSWRDAKLVADEAVVLSEMRGKTLKEYMSKIHPKVRGMGAVYYEGKRSGSYNVEAAIKAGVVTAEAMLPFRGLGSKTATLKLEKIG